MTARAANIPASVAAIIKRDFGFGIRERIQGVAEARTAPATTTTMQLEPGDTLLLFSDGVNEAEDGQGKIFGFARLREVFADHARDSLDSLQQAILGAVESFAQGASQSDDITLLAVRYRTPVDA